MRYILSCLVAFCLLLLACGNVFAHGASGSTTIAFSPNPAPLVAGDDVKITTTTTSSEHPEKVDSGKVTIQLATDGSGNPVPSASVVTWVPLNDPGQNPSGGVTTLDVDLDTLGFSPGTTGGFRAHYVTGGGQHKVDTHFSLAVDLTAVASIPSEPCTGLTIGATLADGNGTPCPGDDGPWKFRITLENCTGVNLTNVKVQGGTNGWAPMTGYAVSKGTLSNVKQNKKNQVLTWTVNIDDGEKVSIDVTVNGTIPSSSPCSTDPNEPVSGSIRYISGAWSAVYNDGSGPQKTGYTGRVSLTVICCP